MHGDLGQGAREQALRAFRAGKVDVLVATDVAARGIDVDNVTHVVNYECPDDEKTYLHRIGRTGRAGNSGTAVTFVDWADIARWQMIDRALKLPFKDPIETYSTSDHVFTGLNIPAGTSGTLPKAARTRQGLAAEEVEDLGETGKKKHGDHGDRQHHDRGGDRGRGRSDKSHGDKRADGHHHDKKHHDKPTAVAKTEPTIDDKPRQRRQRRRTKGGESTEAS